MANSKMISNQEQTPNIQRKELTDYNILKAIESNSSVSQRGLSSQMQINVASVNFALKRLIKKGFIRMVGINPRRIKYFVTPEGVREKTQLAYRFFGRNLHFYKEVRCDIEARIAKATNGKETEIAIYGVGGLAEITYSVVSLMKWQFLGFFLEDSKDTNEGILSHEVQTLESLKEMQSCLLLLTDELSEDFISHNNLDTLNLLNYYKQYSDEMDME
jgi:DNA-binding MarR family transcriptional regulator